MGIKRAYKGVGMRRAYKRGGNDDGKIRE